MISAQISDFNLQIKQPRIITPSQPASDQDFHLSPRLSACHFLPRRLPSTQWWLSRHTVSFTESWRQVGRIFSHYAPLLNNVSVKTAARPTPSREINQSRPHKGLRRSYREGRQGLSAFAYAASRPAADSRMSTSHISLSTFPFKLAILYSPLTIAACLTFPASHRLLYELPQILLLIHLSSHQYFET